MKRELRTSDFAPTFATCPVCDGEGFVPIFAVSTGQQTSYCLQCPHCLGFGKSASNETIAQRYQGVNNGEKT